MSRAVESFGWPAGSRSARTSPGNGVLPVSVVGTRAADRALAYAEGGWPVFPCKSGTKEPATRHGFHDATTDADEIRAWWRRWPGANVAIATGSPGPDVLDVDHHGDAGNGYTALLRLRRAGLLGIAGPVVRTPHGGMHLYFAGSTQASGRLPHHHLDFKAAGGYVLAPPSHVDGRPYYLVREVIVSDGLSWAAVTETLEPHPDRPVKQPAAASSDVGRLAAWVERLEEGNRNAGLFWAACRVVESDQAHVLDDIASAAAATGLSDREIARTIGSALRRRGRHPGREAAL